MTVALAIFAYVAVFLACVYAEARLTGDAALGPMWMIWPLMLPIVCMIWAVALMEKLGVGDRDQ